MWPSRPERAAASKSDQDSIAPLAGISETRITAETPHRYDIGVVKMNAAP